jgi:hypothetical protein
MADPIAFKLNDDETAKLQIKTDQYGAPSLHRFAKRIVLDYLKDGERERLRKEIADLHHEVIRLREDFAAVVRVLLLRSGKLTTPQEVQEWIERNLLH